MLGRTVKIPGPDHPTTVVPSRERVVIHIGDRLIADMREALVLQGSDCPAVRHVPRKDIGMAGLSRSETRICRPDKGDASCFGIPTGGERAGDAVWIYERSHGAVAASRVTSPFTPIAWTTSKSGAEPCRA